MPRLVSLLLLLVAASQALVAAPMGARCSAAATRRSGAVTMGGAQDGPFTPIVLTAKVALGETRLNKIRGKAISYHSQAIGEFCEDYGVPRQVKMALIKKAKNV